MMYTAHASPFEDVWELEVDGVGVTMCYDLSCAEETVQEFVSLVKDVRFDEVEVEVKLR